MIEPTPQIFLEYFPIWAKLPLKYVTAENTHMCMHVYSPFFHQSFPASGARQRHLSNATKPTPAGT